MDHVGDVELVGEKDAVDSAEVVFDGALASFDRELEVVGAGCNNAVKVNLLRADGELLARHLGTLEQGLDKNTHASVLVADDVDEVAAGGGIAGDGVVLQHLACQADSGYGGFDFVGHVVDEVGLHLVESSLEPDGAYGENEERRDEDYHADADEGVEIGVAAEDDGGRGEGEDDIEVAVGDDAVGVEGVFKGGVAEVVGVGVGTAIEQGVAVGHQHTDVRVDVDAVDDKLFADKGVEQGEVELRSIDDVVDVEGVGFARGIGADGGKHSIPSSDHGVVLRQRMVFGRGKMSAGDGVGTILRRNTELYLVLVVEELAVVAYDVLHALVHVVDASVAQEAVTLFFGDIVLDLHLVELVEYLVDGVVDADVEKIVAHLGRTLRLRNLDDNQTDGSQGKNGGEQYEEMTLHNKCNNLHNVAEGEKFCEWPLFVKKILSLQTLSV